MSALHSLRRRLAAVETRRRAARGNLTNHGSGDPYTVLRAALGANEPMVCRDERGAYDVIGLDGPRVPAAPLIAALAARIAADTLTPDDLRVLAAVDSELRGADYDARSYVATSAFVQSEY